MAEVHAGVGGACERALDGNVETVADFGDGRAVAAARRHLHERCTARDEDLARHADRLRRVGEGLCVVTGAARHHPGAGRIAE